MTEVTEKFKLEQITVYNHYTADNKKVSGTVIVKHGRSETKMEFKLNEDDIARVFEIISDRITATMAAVSSAIIDDIRPQQLLEQQRTPQDEVTEVDLESQIPYIDNEIPF